VIKGGAPSSSMASQIPGIRVSSSVYGKTVKLLYGLTQAAPDLIWYNDWKASGSPSNQLLASLMNQAGGKKSSKGGKKSGAKYFSAAVDLVLGHAPVLGVLSAWYNNQKLAIVSCSASGFVTGGEFDFTPVAASSTETFTGTIPSSGPYTLTVSDFVSDLNQVKAAGVGLSPAIAPPGAGQYSVDAGGTYTFNSAQAGLSVTIKYRKTSTGSSATLAGIFAATVAETFSETFDDYGAPGSETVHGTWDRPLWNAAFAVPGRIDAGAYRARDPYTWWWNGVDAKAFFPAGLEGLPVTVYYGVPAILHSDGSFFSSTHTPLDILNLEFERALGSGTEYTNHLDQQVVQDWCSGVGSVRFDLGMANSMPNLNLEVIGAFTQWPDGDADVADVVADIVASGPVLV